MEQLYRRADKFSTLEDNIRVASQTVMITTQSNKPATKAPSGQKSYQGKSQKRSDGQAEKKKDPPQFTALNIAYDQLLPLIRDLPDFKWPPPIRVGPDQRNRSLQCDYHRDHGHETNNCQSLKFLVEKLIRADHLQRYLRGPASGTPVVPATDKAVAEIEYATEPRSTINFILGGPADSQFQSKQQQRIMLRTASIRARVNIINNQGSAPTTQPVDDPISFPPINPTQVITPHYDTLVLTVCINSFDVHRVFVDPGSTTDLLHLSAFKQMKVSINHLHSSGKIMPGFNGATTLSIEDITFPVKAGLVTHQVLFSVVEDLGPYNAILGRTWLHVMKAVPSTYHQKISYLTKAGQVDLQGSQLAVRQCYQTSTRTRAS